MHPCDIDVLHYTNGMLLAFLTAPAHQLPRQGLKTDNLMRGAQGISERLNTPEITET